MSATPRTRMFDCREIAALIAASPCPWWCAFIELSVTTGMRIDEVLRLHASDVCDTTLSVRVTSDAVGAPGDTELVTLRRWLPAHRERVVPIPASAMRSLTRLRSERPGDSHVFVPDWKLDQLWSRIVTASPVTTNHLSPGLPAWFRMIQRRARHVLAREWGLPLAEVAWTDRSVASLRFTAACQMAERLTPRELAAQLGCASTASVAFFYRENFAERGAE